MESWPLACQNVSRCTDFVLISTLYNINLSDPCWNLCRLHPSPWRTIQVSIPWSPKMLASSTKRRSKSLARLGVCVHDGNVLRHTLPQARNLGCMPQSPAKDWIWLRLRYGKHGIVHEGRIEIRHYHTQSLWDLCRLLTDRFWGKRPPQKKTPKFMAWKIATMFCSMQRHLSSSSSLSSMFRSSPQQPSGFPVENPNPNGCFRK